MSTHLFASDVLAGLFDSRTGVVLDFDGTLAPIVDDRERAEMSPGTRALLRKVVLHYPCAVLSGRSRQDVTRRLWETGVPWIVASHGADWGWTTPEADELDERVKSWRGLLDKLLEGVAGVSVEDKRFSLAVHYRRARYPDQTRSVVLAAANRLPRARVFAGNRVVNIIPDNAPSKGKAVQALRGLLCCEWILYVGDDATDEEVFALDDDRLVTVRVEASEASRARFHLNGQHEIDQLLSALAAAREQRRAVGAG